MDQVLAKFHDGPQTAKVEEQTSHVPLIDLAREAVHNHYVQAAVGLTALALVSRSETFTLVAEEFSGSSRATASFLPAALRDTEAAVANPFRSKLEAGSLQLGEKGGQKVGLSAEASAEASYSHITANLKDVRLPANPSAIEALSNPHLNGDQLSRISQDFQYYRSQQSPLTRSHAFFSGMSDALASHPNTPDGVLRRLTMGRDLVSPKTLESITAHPNAEAGTLTRIAGMDHYVSKSALQSIATHPNADALTLDALARREGTSLELKAVVVRNTNVSNHTLKALFGQ